ncbi:MAG TPA: alpha/beta hydrolase family protein [Isosphaeraceae bacterium]|jgi:dienelactone hydrolase|nr:alpha/beta hydrolase family protein [Isosphaeraceae bacterium]
MQAGLLWLILAASGLDKQTEKGVASFRPTSFESAVPETFRLEAATFDFERERIRTEPTFSVWAVRFASPIVSPDPANNTVHAEYFRPTGAGRRPAVVVLHILGADFALSRYLAARLAERGVAALFVKLPYYGERRPAGGAQRFLSADIDRSITSMRQGVCDVRRAVAWLASQPEVDPDRLGVTGISLGGIVAAVAAAVDPTLNSAALLLAGGDLADILWSMPEASRYRERWIASGRTRADLEALTRPFDPLTYAPRLKAKRVMMIAGKVDEVIPPSSVMSLWEAAGRPPIRWYDCGHYSAASFLLPALRHTVDFFAAD